MAERVVVGRWRRRFVGGAAGVAIAAAVVVTGGSQAQAICPLPAPETCDDWVDLPPIEVGDGTSASAATLFVAPYNPATVRLDGLTFTLANNPLAPLPPVRTYTFAQYTPNPPLRQTPYPPMRVELPAVGTLELATITAPTPPMRTEAGQPIPPIRVSLATLYSAETWTVTPTVPLPPIRLEGTLLSAFVRLQPNPPIRAGTPIPPIVEGDTATFTIAAG